MNKQDIFWSHLGLKPVSYKDCPHAGLMRVECPEGICHYEDTNGDYAEKPEILIENLLNIAVPYLQDKGYIIRIIFDERKGSRVNIENVIDGFYTGGYVGEKIEDNLYRAIQYLIDKGKI